MRRTFSFTASNWNIELIQLVFNRIVTIKEKNRSGFFASDISNFFWNGVLPMIPLVLSTSSNFSSFHKSIKFIQRWSIDGMFRRENCTIQFWRINTFEPFFSVPFVIGISGSGRDSGSGNFSWYHENCKFLKSVLTFMKHIEINRYNVFLITPDDIKVSPIDLWYRNRCALSTCFLLILLLPIVIVLGIVGRLICLRSNYDMLYLSIVLC